MYITLQNIKASPQAFDSFLTHIGLTAMKEFEEYELEHNSEPLKSAPAVVTPPNLDGLKELHDLVDRQAEDEKLWFKTETASEAYLQQKLRKLHQCLRKCRAIMD